MITNISEDVVTVIVKMNKNIYLFLVLTLLLSTSLISASYYSGNYGYENYNKNYYNNYNRYNYNNYYKNYDYSHNFQNSQRNYNHKPNLISVSSRDRYDDGYVYRSKKTSFRSYNSYYPGYSGEKYKEREYVLNRYHPWNSHVKSTSHKKSLSTSSYNQHSESNFKILSRPEHYVALWGYR